MATLKLVEGDKAPTSPLNVIFVHGLGGDARTTWMHNPDDHTTLWPKWIREDSGCAVWLLGYDAALSGWSEGAMPLESQGSTVLDILNSTPALDGAPLVMVGHSLGGLVIKSALANSVNYGDKRHAGFVDQLAGVVFVATPHFGSDLANLATLLRLLLRTNVQVGDLESNNKMLESLNRQFLVLQQKHGFGVRVFRETQGVSTPSKWLFFRGPTIRVVSDLSGDPSIAGETAVSLPENHISIAKPASRDSQIHKSLLSFLLKVEQRLANESAAKSQAVPGGATAMSPPAPSVPPEVVPTTEELAARAIDPSSLAPTPTELAFAQFGLDDPLAPMIAAVCIVTDDPAGLAREISECRARLLRDPLIPETARERARKADLPALAVDSALRARFLDGLSVTTFSAYLYFGARAALANVEESERRRRFLVQPLVHRLSKKSEVIVKARGDQPGLRASFDAARKVVQAESARDIPPVDVALPTDRGGRSLVELAQLVANASAAHLAAPGDEAAATLFDHLRTRIRFALNVATMERHTRDRNPLP